MAAGLRSRLDMKHGFMKKIIQNQVDRYIHFKNDESSIGSFFNLIVLRKFDGFPSYLVFSNMLYGATVGASTACDQTMKYNKSIKMKLTT